MYCIHVHACMLPLVLRELHVHCTFQNVEMHIHGCFSLSDYASSLLREGRGACFFVAPSTTELPPFSSVTLTVTAYSNMWGQYTDQLICKVSQLLYMYIKCM